MNNKEQFNLVTELYHSDTGFKAPARSVGKDWVRFWIWMETRLLDVALSRIYQADMDHEELLADKERVDWLEDHLSSGGLRYHTLFAGSESLREAIDRERGEK